MKPSLMKSGFLAILIAATTVIHAGPVIYNTDFTTDSGWNVWPAGQTLVIDRKVFHSGTGALRPAATAYTYWKLKPEMRYRLTVRLKHEGKGPMRSKLFVKYNKEGQGNGSAGQEPLPLPPIASDADPSAWREVVINFETPPETAQAQFLAIADPAEKLWIDSLTLTEEESVAVVVPPPVVLENKAIRVTISAAGGTIVSIEEKRSGRALFSSGFGRDGLALVKLTSPRRVIYDLHTLEKSTLPGHQVLLARCEPTRGALQGFRLEKRFSLPDTGEKITVEMRLIAPTADIEPWVFNFLPTGARHQAIHWVEQADGYVASPAGGDVTLAAPRGRGLALVGNSGLGLLAHLTLPPTRFSYWKGTGESTLEWPMPRDPDTATNVWTASWTLLPFDAASFEDAATSQDVLLVPLAKALQAAAAERVAQDAAAPVDTIPPHLTEMPRLPANLSGFIMTDRIEPEAFVLQGQPTPIAFACVNPKNKPTLILELPADMNLHGGIRGLTFSPPEAVERDGKAYRRHRITLAAPGQMWCRILWSTEAAPGAMSSGCFWAEWGEGQKQPEQMFSIQVLKLPEVQPLTRMPVYLSIPSDLAEVWLKSGADPTCLGFNMLDIWPYTRGRSASGAQSVRTIMELAQPLGLKIGAWAGEWWWADAPKRDLEGGGRAMGLDGKLGQKICPTYRGRYFEELLDHGRFLIDLGIRRHVFDPEIYGGASSIREVCYCPRCREQFVTWFKTAHPGLTAGDPMQFMQGESPDKVLRAAWLEFRALNYAGMFADYRLAIETYLKEKSPEDTFFWMLLMNAYHRGRPSYYGFEDYRDSPLYTESLEDPGMLASSFEVFSPMIYPDIYANYGPYDMQLPWKDTHSLRALVAPKSDVAPILTAGYPYATAYDSDFPTSAMKAQILEAIAGGARGFGIWGVCPADAADLQAIAETVAMLMPVESLLMEADPVNDLRDLDGKVLVKGVASAAGKVMLVSDYSSQPKTARVSVGLVTVPMTVTDLATGQKVGSVTPDNPVFTVTLDKERVRLFHIAP